jgi:hypothetical protein
MCPPGLKPDIRRIPVFGYNRGGAGRKQVGVTSRRRVPRDLRIDSCNALKHYFDTPRCHQIRRLFPLNSRIRYRKICHLATPDHQTEPFVRFRYGTEPGNLPLDCHLQLMASRTASGGSTRVLGAGREASG